MESGMNKPNFIRTAYVNQIGYGREVMLKCDFCMQLIRLPVERSAMCRCGKLTVSIITDPQQKTRVMVRYPKMQVDLYEYYAPETASAD